MENTHSHGFLVVRFLEKGQKKKMRRTFPTPAHSFLFNSSLKEKGLAFA